MSASHVQFQNDTMRDALRVQTKDVHEKLHHHGHFVALFKGTSSLRQYRDLLERFHGFYTPLEHAIERTLATDPDLRGGFTYAKRAHLLEQDLIALGCRPDDIRAGPRCDGLSKIVSPKTLGGVLYVIEGSTLGATQIDRAAQKLLDHDTTRGRQFWAWCRANNKQRWFMTLQYLDHLEAQHVPTFAVVDGATQTFQALADWLAPMSLEGAHA